MPCPAATPLLNFYTTLVGMSVFLFLLLAEGALVAHANSQFKARKQLVQKWIEGSLSLEELNYLKESLWFKRQVLKPPKQVDLLKKNL